MELEMLGKPAESPDVWSDHWKVLVEEVRRGKRTTKLYWSIFILFNVYFTVSTSTNNSSGEHTLLLNSEQTHLLIQWFYKVFHL